MSGSGGGGGNDDTWRPTSKPVPRPKGGAGDGEREPPPDPCNITENTTLNSPDRTVLASLRVGDMLTVVFQPGPPRRLVAEQSPGVVAGSITSPQCCRSFSASVETGMLMLPRCYRYAAQFVRCEYARYDLNYDSGRRLS
jgi:hypothetical protein